MSLLVLPFDHVVVEYNIAVSDLLEEGSVCKAVGLKVDGAFLDAEVR